MEWRRLYRIDTIQEEFKPPEVLTKYFAAGIPGQDKFLGPSKRFRQNIKLPHGTTG